MVETVSSTVSLVRADPSNEFQIFLLETDPETIILTFARKLERVPVKLDRPRFKRRRGGEDSRERERERRLPRSTPLSNTRSIRAVTANGFTYALHLSSIRGISSTIRVYSNRWVGFDARAEP